MGDKLSVSSKKQTLKQTLKLKNLVYQKLSLALIY